MQQQSFRAVDDEMARANHFLFDVEHAGDEGIQVPGNVDEKRSVRCLLFFSLSLLLGDTGRDAFVALGEVRVALRSSSRNT